MLEIEKKTNFQDFYKSFPRISTKSLLDIEEKNKTLRIENKKKKENGKEKEKREQKKKKKKKISLVKMLMLV